MANIYIAAGVSVDAADWRRCDNVKNTVAAGAPGVNDDETDGHEVFSRWLDSTGAPDVYECKDASTGGAVWEQVTSAAGTESTANNVLRFERFY